MLRKYIIYTITGQVSRIFLATIASSILARALGVEDRGIYALAIWMPTTLSLLAQYGLPSINGTYPGLYSEQRRAIFIYSIIIAAISCSITLLVYFLLFHNNWIPASFQTLSKELVYSGAFLLPLLVFESVVREFCRGCAFVKETVSIVAISFLVRVALLFICLVILHQGVVTAIWIVNIASLFSIAAYIYVVRNCINVNVANVSNGLFVKMVKAGLIFMFGSGAMSLLTQAPIYFLSLYQSTAVEIGLFAVAWMVSTQVEFLPLSISQAFLPKICNDITKSAEKTPMLFKFNFLLCLLSMLALALFARPLISIIAGTEYLESVKILMFMLPGVAMYGSSRVLGVYLWAHEKQKYTAISNWLALIVTLFCCFVFVPDFKGIGAAVSVTIGRGVLLVSVIISYCLVSRNNIKQLLINREDISFFIKQGMSLRTGARK